MRTFRYRILPSVLGFCLAGVAQAGPVYSYAFDQSNYTVAAGGTVDVKVYLQEDDTSGGTGFLQSTGVIGAGVLVSFNDPTASQPATVASVAGILPDVADFAGPPGPTTIFNPGVSAGFVESVGLGFPVTAAGSGPIYQIYIGEFIFTAGDVAGDVTHLIATTTAPGSSDNVGGDFPPTVLDPLLNNGTATITVTSVPEPSTLMLLGIGGSFVIYGSVRRRTANSSGGSHPRRN